MYNLKLFINRRLQNYRSPRRPIEKFIPLILFFGIRAVAAATDSSLPIVTQATVELPPTPFLVSWCEGKYCEKEFSKKIVCKADLFNEANSTSKKVGELVIGETVETRVYYTKILKLGSYQALEGATKTLVSRADEHSWLSFFDHAWDSENDPVEPVTFPETEGWALVKTQKGFSGFVKLEGKVAKACPFQRVSTKSK